MSKPNEKNPPLPERMTARAAASPRKASNAADSSSTTSGFRAFTFPRSRTTVAIPFSRRTATKLM
jgi:hypothetical protein